LEGLEQKSFTHVPQPKPHCFIQWKGTDVCMDFQCECGQHYHIDAEFCYAIKCVKCEAVWEMPSYVYPRRVKEDRAHTSAPSGCTVKTEIDENGEGWACKS